MAIDRERTPEYRYRNGGQTPFLVHALVEQWASRRPDDVAVKDAETELNYAELNATANSLARVLRSRGVRRGSMVATALGSSPELVVAMLATLKAGGAYVPMDRGYPRDRLALMTADARAVCTVTTRGIAADLDLEPATTVIVDESLYGHGDASNLDLELTGSDAAYLMYTSGSTGTPKGVVVDHDSIVALVTLDRRIAVAPGDVVVQLASIAFDAATFELWAPLCSGGTVAFVPPHELSILELGEQLRSLRPDWLFLTTGLFQLLVDRDVEALASVGNVLTGGDVLSPRHISAAARRPRVALYSAYGPTETTTFASVHRIVASCDYERVPLGTPLTGMRMLVLDEELREAADGVSGEIYIGGAGVARGYHARPDLTAAHFVPDPYADDPGRRMYRTGDVGRRTADGVIEFVGRVDRQVKIRGFRVELGEVEAALARCPGVAASAVLAVECGAAGKRLVAYAAPQDTDALSGPIVRAWLARCLPGYMVPTSYVVMERLPLDHNRKVRRDALPYPWRRRSSPLRDDERPRTEVERTLAAVWADALELDEVGLHDDFFDGGGNSLLSVDMLAELRERGLMVSAHDLFQNPTIAALAPHVRVADDKAGAAEASV